MHGIPGTVTDRAYVEALEARGRSKLDVLGTEAAKVVDTVQGLFQLPAVDDAGIVVSDALYKALAALQFVADWAEAQS